MYVLSLSFSSPFTLSLPLFTSAPSLLKISCISYLLTCSLSLFCFSLLIFLPFYHEGTFKHRARLDTHRHTHTHTHTQTLIYTYKHTQTHTVHWHIRTHSHINICTHANINICTDRYKCAYTHTEWSKHWPDCRKQSLVLISLQPLPKVTEEMNEWMDEWMNECASVFLWGLCACVRACVFSQQVFLDTYAY